MAKQTRNRAKVLTTDALKMLKEQIRQRERDENAAAKYSLEKLGELTGLDPETVKKVLDRQGTDRRSLDRCFTTFGLTLTNQDYISAVQATLPQSDPNFVGREEAIADLTELVNRNTKIIVIQARGGVGKTTLARRFLNQEFDSFLEFPIAKETKDIASIESLLEEKLRQLGEEPGREFIVSCDRLKRKLQNEPIGILIDNLEPALDSAGKFIEPHRRYVEVLRILADPSVQSTTIVTSRERLSESSVTAQTYLLKSLDVSAWKEFFQSRELAADSSALTALHSAYGGNAKAMEIISGAIVEDFEGNVEAYWDANQDDLFIERDLEDLVKQQFDRLEQLNLDAYKLLCRMGCYRYQDVPTVPIEGLFCLLWDVSENRHRRVIKALGDRSLIESENGEYWLHPVIRMEAVLKLSRGLSWEISNHKAATFWTDNVQKISSTNDALKAFESYHHYLSACSLEMASDVLLKTRKNKLGETLTLGDSFYRMGLTNHIIVAVEEIINDIESPKKLIRLYGYLCDANRIIGKIREAISHQEIAINISENRALQKFFRDDSEQAFFQAYSLITKGLCYLYRSQIGHEQ
ncbi:MAG: hypothetical protein ACFE0J_10865 [Elainellaceae cyanobacterium]